MADLAAILKSGLPDGLVDELLRQHVRAHQRLGAGDSEGALEAVGKYAEVAIRCNERLVTGSSTSLQRRLPRYDGIVRTIEGTPSGSSPESLRVISPRVLHAVYTIRNKRRGGHVSGEVSPQRIDALLTLQMADWFLAELTRVLGQLTPDEGQALVDSLVQRRIPVVYRDEHVHVVTRRGLELRDEILVLVYSEAAGLTAQHIITSTGAPRTTAQRVIDSVVTERLAYKTLERPFRLRLLPLGIREVEDRGLLSFPDTT